MNDALGDRMKGQYEIRSQTYLPRRTYAIIRVDGKAFHTYTKNFTKPFDTWFIHAMDDVARRMCEEIQGAAFAYTQSDEISILLTDFTKATTDSWFDYNIQKMVSIAASMATSYFDIPRFMATDPVYRDSGHALFDGRVFAIPDPIEVENYFIWRQKDWVRNSLQMLARKHYSHKELHEKSCSEMHEMIHQKGDNWALQSERIKNGGWVVRDCPGPGLHPHWITTPAFIFTQERDKLKGFIPAHGYDM